MNGEGAEPQSFNIEAQRLMPQTYIQLTNRLAIFFSCKMNALKVAIDANNVGVSLLENKRYEEALDVFRSAADLMYAVTKVMEVSPRKVDLTSSSSENDNSTFQKIREAQAKVRKVNAWSGKENQPLSQPLVDTDCLIHTRGFQLQNPAEDSMASCAILSAAILANMGLVYHLAVPERLRSNAQAFCSALTLYKMAYSVASRVECSELSAQLVMVTLNNMGCIHHERGLYDESRQILNMLQEFIRHQTKSGDSTFSAEKRVFLLNALFLGKPRGAPAA